jgi:hypothetical protein
LLSVMFMATSLIAVAWAEGMIGIAKEITSPYWLNERRKDQRITLTEKRLPRRLP